MFILFYFTVMDLFLHSFPLPYTYLVLFASSPYLVILAVVLSKSLYRNYPSLQLHCQSLLDLIDHLSLSISVSLSPSLSLSVFLGLALTE
jgi:hypothetical protein